jgi:CPA1 family monovalent cation:H+ antiporter
MTNLHVFDIAAILVVVAALFGVVNHHVLRLPFTIGITVSGLIASVVIAAADRFLPGFEIAHTVQRVLMQIDFPEALMHGMLGFLLFAGALHVDFNDLIGQRWTILSLATIGVLVSTVIVGFGSWALFRVAGLDIPLAWCFVFGALISPTDPIAVLGIMKSAGVPESLEVKVVGESLFNDGVGVVVFSLLLAAAAGRGAHGLDALHVLEVFLVEVVGGVLLGLVAGYLVYRLMASLEEANLEVLLSVALVMGVTFVAFQLHASAPLACVVAGLFIGNHGRRFSMGESTRQALDIVWSFLDETLNAVLFLLIALEVFAVRFEMPFLRAAVALIPLALAARFVAVALPISALRLRQAFTPGAVRILTWGGLRGGISIALALSLPAFDGRDAILVATYAIVLFSLLAQGLSLGPVIRRLAGTSSRTRSKKGSS